MVNQSYLDEIQAWRLKRVNNLKEPHGWISTAGLFWLEEGENRMGADNSCPILLPPGSAPEVAGSFYKSGDQISLSASPGVEICFNESLVSSLPIQVVDGSSEAISLGEMKIYVLKRGDRFGVRIFDPNHPALKNFKGLSWFPIDERFRLQTRFTPYSEPRSLSIINILGDLEEMASPGVVEFEFEGKTCQLEPIERDDRRLWFMFRDTTNGELTYSAGRYLVSEPPADGKVMLDFNKAYNPPCAFTDFATCPLPPPNNRLAIAIRAGELKFHN
jgi:uncharacterized protein (DUF1684 family)